MKTPPALSYVIIALRALWHRLVPPAPLPELLLTEVVQDEEDADSEAQVGLQNSYHIRGLLDRLPAYFEDLRALRRVDDAAYDIFSRLGGTLAGEDGLFRSNHIPPEVVEAPPHVRCLFLSDYSNAKGVVPLIYMMRMAGGQLVVSQSGHAALPPGLNYRVVSVWRTEGKPPLAEEWFVHIDGAGQAHVLPQMITEAHRMPMTNRARRKGNQSFARRVIRPEPPMLADAAKERGVPIAEEVQVICSLVLSAARPKECVLVRATLGKETAAWTIDRNDAKRFFRQRETGLAVDGKRKRVLHYVAPFARSNGQQVREHYRGERAFDWNGYRVEVSGLGFHHTDAFDADMPQYDGYTTNLPGMISLRKATKALRQRYRKPVFLSRH